MCKDTQVIAYVNQKSLGNNTRLLSSNMNPNFSLTYPLQNSLRFVYSKVTPQFAQSHVNVNILRCKKCSMRSYIPSISMAGLVIDLLTMMSTIQQIEPDYPTA